MKKRLTRAGQGADTHKAYAMQPSRPHWTWLKDTHLVVFGMVAQLTCIVKVETVTKVGRIAGRSIAAAHFGEVFGQNQRTFGFALDSFHHDRFGSGYAATGSAGGIGGKDGVQIADAAAGLDA